MRFARTLVLTLGAAIAASAGADNGGYVEVKIGAEDPDHVFIHVLAGPNLAGKPAMIQNGVEPFSGPFVGGGMLHVGWNIFPAPKMPEANWYTIVSPGVAPGTVERVGTRTITDEDGIQ